MNYVRLPLEGAENTRELGGYPTKTGKCTNFHVYIRSSKLTDLTKKDNEFLKEYGVTDIIDLRGSTSIQKTFVSDDNYNPEYFKFHYIPLSNTKVESYIRENEFSKDFNFGIGYGYILENKEKIKEVFDVLASAKGAVLYHCTAGKDRTGIVSALILGLCGVKDEDIIANYLVTSIYISSAKYMSTYSENMKRSDALFISTFINELRSKYGSFESYLLSCDISKENLEKIKNKICK